MSDNKDFLAELSNEGKPESFQKEKIEYVNKKSNFNYKKIGLVLVIVLVLFGGFYLFTNRPTIKVEDFVGQNVSVVNNWVRQNSIESNGVAVEESYSNEYDENVIFGQSIDPDTMVKKDVKITFQLSKGSDPEEKIDFPDLKDLNSVEVSEWINENKLSGVKQSTLYSNTVEKGMVISYELTDVDEANFLRSSKLDIVISKGKAPVKSITITDFVGKSYSEVDSFAKTNKLVLVKKEDYSDSVVEGQIISQSVSSGSSLDQGETLTVTVSKGQAVFMKSLVGMSEKEALAWLTTTGINYEIIGRYQNKHNTDTIISQSIGVNQKIEDDSFLTIIKSLGYINLADFLDGIYVYNPKYNPKTFFALESWVYQVDHEGDAQMPGPIAEYVDSEYPEGTIISFDVDSQYLDIGTTIKVTVSNGSLSSEQETDPDLE